MDAYTWFWAAWQGAMRQSPDAPAFQMPDGFPVTYKFMLKWVKALMGKLGVDSGSVGLHSFRIGGGNLVRTPWGASPCHPRLRSLPVPVLPAVRAHL